MRFLSKTSYLLTEAFFGVLSSGSYEISARDRKELENFHETMLLQLAAASALALSPLCIAAFFGATPRNVPFPEIRIAIQIMAAAGTMLALLSLWCMRHEQSKAARVFPVLVSISLTLDLAVLCWFVSASQTRAARFIQHFPNIETSDLYPKIRAVTGAVGASNFGLIGAMGFALLALSSLPVKGKHRLIYFIIFQGLLTFSIGTRVQYEFFFMISLALTSLGTLFGILRTRDIIIDGRRAIQLRQLAERDAVLEYEHELDLAAEIQHAMVPPRRWKSSTRVEVQSFTSLRHKVGGEWLAVRETNGGDLFFAVATVEGSGLHAALIAHSIAAIWSVGKGQQDFDADDFLQRVNSALCVLGRKQKHIASMAIVRISKGQLTYWSAGHGPLHLVAGQVTSINNPGTPLGASEKLKVSPTRYQLSSSVRTDLVLGGGDVLDSLACSDGEKIALLEQMRRHGVEVIERTKSDDDVSLIWAQYDPGLIVRTS